MSHVIPHEHAGQANRSWIDTQQNALSALTLLRRVLDDSDPAAACPVCARHLVTMAARHLENVNDIYLNAHPGLQEMP